MTRLILSSLLILTILISGCSSPTPDRTPESTPSAVVKPPTRPTVTPGPDQQIPAVPFIGRVVDMEGSPISDAQIASGNSSATSDKDGWFKFTGEGHPEWLKVTAAGFISRTRAALPGTPILFRLSPDDGKTMVLHLAGDTMFGRRFFDPNEDTYTSDGLLPLVPTVDDHSRLLAPVKRLLENADVTVLNLETTLSDLVFFPKNAARPAAFHPTSAYVYASHPSSVLALKQSGVDIVDLANAHSYDMLEAGLVTTLATLDQAGVLHFGAGINESNAWTPAIVTSKGQSIAFVGCTTMRTPLNTPGSHVVQYVASDVLRKGGAAYCTETRLRTEIVRAKKQADTVIVMIHGGKEYDPTPADNISYLTTVAKKAGAALVINHQPHVVGGFSWKDDTLTAWSMGTFLADQTVWSSLHSYLLAVYLREGKIVRAYVEPLMIEGFLPHGLTSELAEYVARDAAGRVMGPFVMESGAMEVDLNRQALQYTYTESMDGGSKPGTIIPVPQSQWISAFIGSGKLRLGRDLLWVGSFENQQVDLEAGGAPLWDLDSSSIQIGPDYAYEGRTGIRLVRGAKSTSDAVSTNLHPVLVKPYADLSITGMIRIDQSVAAQVQLSWFYTPSGLPFSRTTQTIEIHSYGGWQPFRVDVQAPKDAVAVGLFLRLKPPDKGTATADFDNLRIIEWASPNAKYSPLYDYALLTGSGKLTFVQQILPGAEEWLTVPVSIK